jgi:urease accessory protein
MIRATKVLPAAAGPHPGGDAVALDFDARHRRRLLMTTEGGLEFLLDLPEATALRDGDGLLLEDGRVVLVRAALEPLAEITAADSATLVRLAWHLGNRHLPAALLSDRLLIRRDHVIEDMVAGLGGFVKLVSAPFDPEGGAYGGHAEAQAESHSRAESHSHSHVHDHGHRHSHRHG